mgnify:CR=1 FL=1
MSEDERRRGERPGQGATGDGVEHRGLHLEVAPLLHPPTGGAEDPWTTKLELAREFVGLGDTYHHHRVNHSKGEYVRNYCLHTNGIESVWALFKRQIVGTHHHLSPKHLSRYLGEMTWRFNLREISEGERVNALLGQTNGRLTYKALIA